MGRWIRSQINGLFFALPLMLLLFGLYYGYLVPHRREGCATGSGFWALLIPIAVLSLLLHEGLHGIGWRLFGKTPAGSIVFRRRGILPVCICRSCLRRSHYLAGRLLPLWTLGAAGMAALVLAPGRLSFAGAELLVYLSGADIGEAFSLLKDERK